MIRLINPRVGMPKQNIWPRVSALLMVAGLLLLSFGSTTLILAARETGQVTTTPKQFYVGDIIEISLFGFPPDFPVPAGAISLDGVRVPVPGTLLSAGLRPKTDSSGDVTFSTTVPMGVAFGPQKLTVTHFAGDGIRTVEITVLQPLVSFSPSSVSPNQKIVLGGSGYNPVSNPGGSASDHRIGD